MIVFITRLWKLNISSQEYFKIYKDGAESLLSSHLPERGILAQLRWFRFLTFFDSYDRTFAVRHLEFKEVAELPTLFMEEFLLQLLKCSNYSLNWARWCILLLWIVLQWKTYGTLNASFTYLVTHYSVKIKNFFILRKVTSKIYQRF